MLRLRDIIFRPIEQKYHAFSPRCMLEGRLFYCTAKTVSLMKEVLLSWEIRGNYATKSTLAECVKRFCLGCIDELLAAHLEYLRVANLTEAKGGYKFGSPKCFFFWGGGVGRGSGGTINSTNTRYLAHGCLIFSLIYFDVWSTIMNSLIFILMINNLKCIFISVYTRS